MTIRGQTYKVHTTIVKTNATHIVTHLSRQDYACEYYLESSQNISVLWYHQWKSSSIHCQVYVHAWISIHHLKYDFFPMLNASPIDL